MNSFGSLRPDMRWRYRRADAVVRFLVGIAAAAALLAYCSGWTH